MNGPPLACSTSSGSGVSSPTDLSLLLWHCQRGKAHQATLHIQPRSRKKQREAGLSREGSHITTHLSTSFSNRSSERLGNKRLRLEMAGMLRLFEMLADNKCTGFLTPAHLQPFEAFVNSGVTPPKSTITCVFLVCVCERCLLKVTIPLKWKLPSFKNHQHAFTFFNCENQNGAQGRKSWQIFVCESQVGGDLQMTNSKSNVKRSVFNRSIIIN